MKKAQPLKRSGYRHLLLGLLGVSMLITACDDYNIVEPRFYDDGDIFEFGICERDFDTTSVRSQAVTTTALVDSGGPIGFGTEVCWDRNTEKLLRIFVVMPMSGALTVSILNSGGGVESVVWDGRTYAGVYLYSWVADSDGVYAISLQTFRATIVVWFEVN